MVPKHLYKFQPLNLQTLRNLKNAQLYFNTPASFNDPFDCSTLEASFEPLDEKNVVDIFKHYMNKKNITLDFEINSIKDVPQQYVNQIHSGIEKTLKEKQRQFLHERGCSCFSEENDNILMWSHYAGGHKGICLKLDTSFELFSKIDKVNYSDDFPLIPIMRLIDNNDKFDNEILKPLYRKSKRWEYEKEWRIFHVEPNKLYGYGVDALKSVFFGLEVDEADIEIVCLILQGQSNRVMFYRAHKDKSSYSLNFEEFPYTPYIKTI